MLRAVVGVQEIDAAGKAVRVEGVAARLHRRRPVGGDRPALNEERLRRLPDGTAEVARL